MLLWLTYTVGSDQAPWIGIDNGFWPYSIAQNQFLGSRRTRSPKSCLSFLLLGNGWVQGRSESDVALIEDPQGNPDPEGVEEEKIDPSVHMSAYFLGLNTG